MKVLIVLAHPEQASLSASLAGIVKEQFEKQGDEVKFTDLYSQNFKSVVDADDFPIHDKSKPLNIIAASKEAYLKKAFTDDVKKEHEELLWADGLVFVFPLWWFSMPAILKGWIDRVFCYGIAFGRGEHTDKKYGDNYGDGLFKGKRAMVVVAAGSGESAYSGRGINGPINDLLFPINHGILYYAGYSVLPPFIVFGTYSVEAERFREIESTLRKRIEEFETIEPIGYRQQNYGDYTIPGLQLKDEYAPDQEGFSIHIRD